MLLRRLLVFGVHLVGWGAALVGAVLVRHEFSVPPYHWRGVLEWLPVLLLARIVLFQANGLFRGMWRYTGTYDIWKLIAAQTSSTVIFATVALLGHASLPRSVFIIEWLLSTLGVSGLRLTTRFVRRGIVADQGTARRLLIVGAGDAGEVLLRELQRNFRSRYQPVGFVDDDLLKQRAHIHGISVLGTIDHVATIAKAHDVDEIVIAIPTADGPAMRRILDLCKDAGAVVRTLPGLDALVDGTVAVNQIRSVDIEDLLGRDPVQLDLEVIQRTLAGKTILVSGAGGSIGSEICRQVCRMGATKLLLVERAENNLFNIHRELVARFPAVDLYPLLADVADQPRIEDVFKAHHPEVVFHAAAHKHVPMMECNPGEAVKNNVFGTKILADVSARFEVERFVMISTDKAVRPSSVMGASKRAAEIYIQTLSRRCDTRFVTVRFGNVLGSAGSVVPIFREQIAAGGPVTVTHPEMTRYFMTIPEASQLVLQAGAMGDGGELFILDMGKPVRIVDIARDLIRISGLQPEVDIAIEFTGIRPGEKLHEELASANENATKTRHPKIFVGALGSHRWEHVCRLTEELGQLADGDPAAIRAKFRQLVPDYGTPDPVPLVTRTARAGGPDMPAPAARSHLSRV
jgi:FlaA1/EpsC-like NDP-sugar epimerase